MRVRMYKTTALGAFIGSMIFSVYGGYEAYAENNLWIFSISFLIAVPIGLYIGKETVKSVKKKIVDNEIVFKKEETLRYLVYALLIGNILLIGLFAGFILLFFEKSQNITNQILENIIYFSHIFSGFAWGIIFTASLFQYIWVYLWEKKTGIELAEKER